MKAAELLAIQEWLESSRSAWYVLSFAGALLYIPAPMAGAVLSTSALTVAAVSKVLAAFLRERARRQILEERHDITRVDDGAR